MDDANACLKRQDIETFHDHTSSIDRHIQFTIEMPSLCERGATIAFLYTSCTAQPNGNIEVTVHRKATHTNKYLAFDSPSPAQHKRAVVQTLMHRATNLPSTEQGKIDEKERVQKDLQINGYTTQFIKYTCDKSPAADRSDKESHTPDKSVRFATIPYIKGVSEKVKKTFKVNIKTAFKPMRTLGHYFKKPKDRPITTGRKKELCTKLNANLVSSHTSASPNAHGTRGGKNTNPARAPSVFQQLNNTLKQQTTISNQNMLN